jgi:hypothetical protein
VTTVIPHSSETQRPVRRGEVRGTVAGPRCVVVSVDADEAVVVAVVAASDADEWTVVIDDTVAVAVAHRFVVPTGALTSIERRLGRDTLAVIDDVTDAYRHRRPTSAPVGPAPTGVDDPRVALHRRTADTLADVSQERSGRRPRERRGR